MSINLCKLIKLSEHTSKTGNLVTFENEEVKGFSIFRIYYIYNLVPGETRGNHAYRNTSQILIPVKGKVSIEVDDGKNTKTIFLEKPSQGIFIPKNIWRKVTSLTDDTLVLVLTDKLYKDCKKISDYQEFLDLPK